MKSTHSTYKSIVVVLLYCTTTYSLSLQDTAKQSRRQQMQEEKMAIPEYFYRPLEYSDTSFSFFLTRIYNHHKYPQHFLALNFIPHVLTGLHLAPQAEQPRRYMSKLFYLFDRKMQGIYINPYAFYELLKGLPAALAPFCSIVKEKNDIVVQIKEYIGTYIIENFKKLQTHPDQTLNELASHLYDVTVMSDTKDLSIKDFQHSLHYFLARGLSNLVWSPTEQGATWELVKDISVVLGKFTEYFMLDEEMLDDLLWVLLMSYVRFIDLCAPDLDQPFFDSTLRDLKAEKFALWLTPERENLITTKGEYLQRALMEAEIKSRTCSSALVVDPAR